MKAIRWLSFAALLGSAFAQQPDPAFYGVWNLDLGRSKITGPPPHSKLEKVLIDPNGWIVTALLDNGELMAFGGATTGGGCALIGWPAGSICEQKFVSPRRMTGTIAAGKFRQVLDGELRDDKTMSLKLEVTLPDGTHFTEERIYRKAPPPAAAKPGSKK